MRYYGGKYRTGKKIASVMDSLVQDKEILGYIEPFCGALGVARHMKGYNCFCSDGSLDLIMLWKAVKNGTNFYEEIDKERWLELRDSEPSAIRGLAGFGCSFSGAWFISYANNKYGRYWSEESYRTICKLDLNNITFSHCDYRSWDLLVQSGGYLIYCDPPYADSTVKHKGSSYDFDIEEFWEYVRKWTSCGNTVVVSEREAPDDFKVVWSKELPNVKTGSKGKYVDNLYVMID